MYQLLKARVTSNPRRAWWNARFTSSDGSTHENAPAPASDTDTGCGAGGYTFGLPGDPDGYDMHCPEAALALAAATTEEEHVAAIMIDVRRVEAHYEVIATADAARAGIDLVLT